MIKTEIGYTTPEVITVRGKNLANDIMGKLDFVDGLMLCTLARLPSAQEKSMLNAILVVGLDHGLTPSALAARLTYLGAPESLQGAVAAGLLGAGTRFLGTTQKAVLQYMEFSGQIEIKTGLQGNAAIAERLIAERKGRGDKLYGYGHPIHKVFDPRVESLREISRVNGFYGANWILADAVADSLSRRAKPLNMNASGAMAAAIGDMGLNPIFGVALMLVGRCAGLVAHLIEEEQSPIAGEIWDLVLKQDDRNRIPDRAAR